MHACVHENTDSHSSTIYNSLKKEIIVDQINVVHSYTHKFKKKRKKGTQKRQMKNTLKEITENLKNHTNNYP